MSLVGQGNEGATCRGERGYAMAALLVGMSIMAVLMGAALPSWTHMAQREKEEEYLFRAKQYARAIRLYQDKMKVANAPAPSVDVLIEQRFLRKKYKDPITGDDFVLIQTPAGGAVVGGPAGTIGKPQQPTQAQQQLQQQLQQKQLQQKQLQQKQQQQKQQQQQGAKTGGFIGVTSKSKAKAIKLFKGQQTTYDQWAMTFMDVPSPMGRGTPGAPGAIDPAAGSPGAPQFGAPGARPGSQGFGAAGSNTTFTPTGSGQSPFGLGTPNQGFGQPTQQPGERPPFGQPVQPGVGQPVQRFPPLPNTPGTNPFGQVPPKPPR